MARDRGSSYGFRAVIITVGTMRTSLASKLAIALILICGWPNAALSDERTWEYPTGGQTVFFGVPETDDVIVRLACTGAGQAQIEMLYSGEPDERFKDGQSIVLPIRNGNARTDITGTLKKFSFDDDFLGWDFVAQLPASHAFFEFLKAGGTLAIGAEPEYTVSLVGAQSPVVEWQLDCGEMLVPHQPN